MLRPRVIPCLLLRNRGLVKTEGFGPHKYVGDPLNAVRIFNEKEVDELMVLDIDATAERREPSYKLIGELAAECRMPLCYGGGVNSVEQVKKIVRMGVEKVAISSAAIRNPDLVARAAQEVGSQSIVVVADVKRKRRLGVRYEIYIGNGREATGRHPVELARDLESLGAGELVINSIDLDGKMGGYDLELVRQVRDATTLPLTVLGGAGSLEDIRELIKEFGVIGAAAGSLFVYKGKFRAVLINYPTREERDLLVGSVMAG